MQAVTRKLDDLAALIGDIGLPDSVVKLSDACGAEGAVGRAQGRPQHHDEPARRRQAGVVHRRLRSPARASRRLRRTTHAKSFAGMARAARGTRMRRSARCTCGRFSTCGATARRRCARSPRRRPRSCASTRAPSRASTATDSCAANGWRGSSGRGSRGRSKRSRTLFDPAGLMNPGKIVRAPRMDDRDALPLSARRIGRCALETGLDWSAWNVQNDPVDRRDQRAPAAAATRRTGFAKAVEMCNNNGHCRKFDAGTMCPSYRVTRDEMHLTRGRANTLRLALSRPARRRRSHPTRCATRSTFA